MPDLDPCIGPGPPSAPPAGHDYWRWEGQVCFFGRLSAQCLLHRLLYGILNQGEAYLITENVKNHLINHLSGSLSLGTVHTLTCVCKQP